MVIELSGFVFQPGEIQIILDFADHYIYTNYTTTHLHFINSNVPFTATMDDRGVDAVYPRMVKKVYSTFERVERLLV